MDFYFVFELLEFQVSKMFHICLYQKHKYLCCGNKLQYLKNDQHLNE